MAVSQNQETLVIQIESCSNSILWYNQHIGETFPVSFYEHTTDAYWVREVSYPYALNWVYAHDAKIVKERK